MTRGGGTDAAGEFGGERNSLETVVPVHLVITTHTPRHLEAVLFGAAWQRPRPTSLTVTCDALHREIDEIVERAARRWHVPILYVRREHQGEARPAQTRNNAARALMRRGVRDGWLLFLDGDILATPGMVRHHAQFAQDAEFAIGGRVMLSEERTRRLDLDRLVDDSNSLQPSDEDWVELVRTERKARLDWLLRRLRLTKPHKPKVIGAHFGIAFSLFERINGLDEDYVGFGMEDDDLARRVYRAGATPRFAIRRVPTFHLWHPTRSQGRFKDNPAWEVFRRRDWRVRCRHGLATPRAQSEVLETLVEPWSDVGPGAGAAARTGESAKA